MRQVLILVGLGLGASVAAAAPQSRDFSGTWMAVKDAPAGVAAAPSPVFGARFALRQAGDTLTLTRLIRDASIEATFALDGREVRTRLPGATCMGDSAALETAVRDGDAIVFTTVGMIPPGGGSPAKLNVRRLFRLEASDTLIVEGTMVQAGQSRAVATVYKRSTDPIGPPSGPASGGAVRASATIADVGWISGVWIAATNTTVEERWTPPSGGAMLAISRTMRNNVMSAFEFLCIVERNGGLIYTAMPNARTPPTDFTLTQFTADSATFENPSHDYPKMIRYTRLPDGSLETTIAGEGGQRPQSVVLKKQ